MIQGIFWARFWRTALAAGWGTRQLPGLWHRFQVEAYGGRSVGPTPGSVRAGDLWQSIADEEADGLSVDALGMEGFRWPEPGEGCADVLATAQLYWPVIDPAGALGRVGGELE